MTLCSGKALGSAVGLGVQGEEEQAGNTEVCIRYHRWQKVASYPIAAVLLSLAWRPAPKHQPEHGGG